MRNALRFVVFIVLLLMITTCKQNTITVPNTEMFVSQAQPQCIIEVTEEAEEEPEVISDELEDITVDLMAKEIEDVWELFFDDGKAPLNDPRREMFHIYAKEIADAIDYYKKNEADIGGRLPDHRSTHIIIAIIITHESSVNPNAVGFKHGEVSMFQLWGKALNGFSKEEVKNNTELAAMLGVRWIAHSTSQCNNNKDTLSDSWRTIDWLRPLTIYGSGPKKTYKDKKKRQCRIFDFARRRVNQIAMYEKRIDSSDLI